MAIPLVGAALALGRGVLQVGRMATSKVSALAKRGPVKKPARRGTRPSGPPASRRGGGAPPSTPGPSNRMEAGRSTPLLDKMWIAQAGMDIADKIHDKLDGNLPSFTHTISVAVRGGPEADLRRVWYLCCAAAFGRYRNRVLGLQQVHLDATWDITGKACSITIGYTNSGMLAVAEKEFSKLFSVPTFDNPLAFIQRGPDQVTVGGNWPSFVATFAQMGSGILPSWINTVGQFIGGQLVYGPVLGPAIAIQRLYNLLNLQANIDSISTVRIPNEQWTVEARCGSRTPMALQLFGGTGRGLFRELPRINGTTTYLPWRRVLPDGQNSVISYGSTQTRSGAIPVLPDDGRLITTGEKLDPNVQHPRPQVDGIGRSSTLSLVAQALQTPCFLVASPPCPVAPLGSSGVEVYRPGEGTNLLGLNDSKIARVFQPSTDASTSSGFWGNLLGTISSALGFTNRGRDGYLPPTSVPNLRG